MLIGQIKEYSGQPGWPLDDFQDFPSSGILFLQQKTSRSCHNACARKSHHCPLHLPKHSCLHSCSWKGQWKMNVMQLSFFVALSISHNLKWQWAVKSCCGMARALKQCHLIHKNCSSNKVSETPRRIGCEKDLAGIPTWVCVNRMEHHVEQASCYLTTDVLDAGLQPTQA